MNMATIQSFYKTWKSEHPEHSVTKLSVFVQVIYEDLLQQTLPGPVSDPKKLPKWNYDGSSTDQAPGDDSEVIL